MPVFRRSSPTPGRFTGWGWLLLAFTSSTAPAVAQTPAIGLVQPRAVAPGQETSVTVRGQGLAGAAHLWTTFSGPIPPAGDIEGNGQSETECVFRVAAPADAPLGIHAVRIVSPRGASLIAPLLIDDLPSVAETGGNQSAATAQEVALPCGIDGRVDNLTRDFFKFHVQAGQTVTLEALARRLGSPLDASLYLYDSQGRILAYSDDAPGLSADPQIVHTFKDEGTYVVELRDIRYQGGDGHTYRLRIGDFPGLNSASPLAVRRGSDARIDFAGVSVADASPAFISVPADWPHGWYPVSTRRAGGGSSAFAFVAVSDTEEVLEREPNDTQPQAQRAPLGASISGRLDQPGDVDRFTFTAAQGDRFIFTGMTRDQGSPADLLLRMLDASGNQLAAVDDNGTAEGVLDFAFPAAGEFTLEVSDLSRRGGPQYAYRIAQERWRPGFSLAASSDTLSVPAGGVAALTVSAARRDYGGAIELTVEGLPEGYAVPSTHIGPGLNQTVLTIAVDAGALPANLSGVSIVGRARIGEDDVAARASVTAALRARWSNAVVVPARMEREVAVAVAPAQPIRLRVEPPVVVFGKNLTATARVIVERGDGMDEAIALAVNPPQDGLPPNVAVDLKPIDKGQTESVATFTANENAALGPFTVVLSGTHQKDNAAVVATTPGIGLRLEPPFEATAAMPESTALPRGGELKLKIDLKRNPAYAGDAKLVVEKLPAGVTAAETVLPADQSTVELLLTAAADAAPATIADALLKITSPADAKLAVDVPLPAFQIQ